MFLEVKDADKEREERCRPLHGHDGRDRGHGHRRVDTAVFEKREQSHDDDGDQEFPFRGIDENRDQLVRPPDSERHDEKARTDKCVDEKRSEQGRALLDGDFGRGRCEGEASCRNKKKQKSFAVIAMALQLALGHILFLFSLVRHDDRTDRDKRDSEKRRDTGNLPEKEYRRDDHRQTGQCDERRKKGELSEIERLIAVPGSHDIETDIPEHPLPETKRQIRIPVSYTHLTLPTKA